MSVAQRPYVILAAIAFDDTGVTALQEAARIAQQHRRAELHLVHVLPPTQHDELLSLHARLAGAPAELQKRIRKVELTGISKVTAHLRSGSPSSSIVQTAVDIDADLLVVGTRRRRGFERLVTGSVAERVVQQAHCPVLIALAKHAPASSVKGAGIEPQCADCCSGRSASDGASYWCERHGRARMVIKLL